MGVNRVSLTGNLTRDLEVRVTGNGTQVANFGVAVNDRRRNQQTGEWEDRPNFIDCVMFGQRVESLSRRIGKGSKVAIDGKLRQNTWQDRETGQNRSKLEVVVDDIDFMQRRDDEPRYLEQQPQQQYRRQGQQPQQPQQAQQGQQPQQQYRDPAPEPGYRQGRLYGADDMPF